ncbi:FAD-dependent monooxygenase [Kutzneria sp. NPDC052558]|uniref:FAD-dependent monooxygenase n=1 Tax=Kutzneria sp. NPDC052558 TaxID=3364121 RepID=UPI0037CB1ADC
MATDLEVPVLVIGAGPTGLTAAHVLGRAGTRSLVVERRAAIGKLPRATGVRIRTMELFRAWGIDDAIVRRAIPVRDGGEFAWVHTVAGEHYGVTTTAAMENGAVRRAATPMEVVFCPQDQVEPVLLDELHRNPNAEVRFSTEVISLAQDDDGVVAVAEDRVTGAVTRIRARYVLGADGAGSFTRRSLGVGMTGPDARASFVNIDFLADLQPYVGDWPAVLYAVINTRASGTLAARDGRRQWYFSVAAGGTTAVDPSDPDSCAQVIRDAIGVPDLDVEIESARTWHMDAKVAEHWRRGNIFLLGDAAHRFPPTGGFGMNSSIHDAHNLAWKLHAVLAGWAGPELLDSYEEERRPVARFNAEQSWHNMDLMAETGVDSRIYEFAAGLEAETDAAQRPLREKIRRGIPLQRPQLDGLGQDIGFVYASRAVISDGTAPTLARSPEFRPSAAPGRRVPHYTLLRNGSESSPLDLVEGRFTLFAGEDGGPWADAARSAARLRGLPLQAFRVTTGLDAGATELRDPMGMWSKSAGTGPDGAFLVRPDGHIAWRTAVEAGPEAATDIGAVLDTILSRKPEGGAL